MTIVRGSISHRKERINSESDLKFLNSSTHSIQPASVLSGIPLDFSVMFFVETHTANNSNGVISFYIDANNNFSIRKGTAAGNIPYGIVYNSSGNLVDSTADVPSDGVTNSDLVKNKSAIVVDVKQSANTIEIWRDSELVETVTDAFITGLDLNGATMNIGSLQTPSLTADVNISHVYIVNRNTTYSEKWYHYYRNGALHKDLHAYCIGHWGCVERYPFKADAAFNAEYPDIAINDNVFVDFVEQYNYDKPRGVITSFADAGGGQVTVNTSTPHNRSNGEFITIPDTTNYNGTYSISNVAATSFEITATWVVTETGTWNKILKANHAKAVNFSDTELGVVNPATQTVKKDFYNKQNLNPFALKFNGTNSAFNNALTTTFGTGTTLSFFVDIILPTAGTIFDFVDVNHGFRLSRAGVSRVNLLIYENSAGSIAANINQNEGIYTFNDFNGKRFKCIYEYDFGTNHYKMYWNNIDVTNPTTSNLVGDSQTINKVYLGATYTNGGKASNDGAINSVYVLDRLTTIKERIDFFTKDKKPETPIYNIECAKRTDGIIIDSLLNSITLNGFTIPEYDSYYVEKETGLPEIKQGFLGVYASRYIKLPTSLLSNNNIVTGDYTIILDYWINRASYPGGVNILRTFGGTNGDLYLYNPSPTTFRFGIQGTPNVISQIGTSLINFMSLQSIIIKKRGANFIIGGGNNNFEIIPNYNVINSDAFPGTSTPDFSTLTDIQLRDDAYFLRAAFFEKELSDKQVQQFRNNSLLSNKLLSPLNCKGYYLFNQGAFSENGVDVLLNDYSGSGNHGTVQGLTGATSADKLADVPNHLIDIEQLR